MNKETESSKKQETEKWEYKVLEIQHRWGWGSKETYIDGEKVKKKFSSGLLEKKLNGLGEKGWELIGQSSAQEEIWITSIFTLKRPKEF